MKKDYQEGKLPYAKPVIEPSDFRVESGIALSFTGDPTKTANDMDILDYWTQQ